jgi:CheY-like chemotaxis protein
METRHVLVVDDEKNTRLALSLIFRKSGFTVTAAADGLEALKKTEELLRGRLPLMLLVIDLQMPGLTGLELVEELEKRNVCLPILFISGYRENGLVERLARKGCVDYLEKPFEPAELIDRVESLLEKFEGMQLEQGMEFLQKC